MDPILHQSNRADGKPIVVAAGTTGSATINRRAGRVNMAAGASLIVVTNKLANANSVILATVGSNDSTLKSVQAVSDAGYFILYGNAAATAETRISFLLLAGA
ncbi:hypothetical protein [EBPR podovirus 3]|jgi:hypothetical protein|nr:hypothetical protein [EBPR podovirus 3]